MSMLRRNSVGFDQSVLSHMLALKNTAGCVSTRVGADYENVMKSEL
jgi:hypothetical protein